VNPVIVVLLFVIRIRATATCCGPGTPMADTSEIHGFIYKMH
jgi:hypothetical protein